MKTKTLISENQRILYDDDLSAHISREQWPNLFSPRFLEKQQLIIKTAQGRNTTYFFQHGPLQLVLRHYYRGGMVGKLTTDRYLRMPLNCSRPYREWKMLWQLQAFHLPAPKPAAIRLSYHGLYYRADLITHSIANAVSLSQLLNQGPLGQQQWQKLGLTIRKFHHYSISHADLNAHNILFRKGEIFVIDFDKSTFSKNFRHHNANLKRLQRSLLKLKSQISPFYFTTSDWEALLTGYHFSSR